MLRDRGNFSLPILLHVKSLNIRMRIGLRRDFMFVTFNKDPAAIGNAENIDQSFIISIGGIFPAHFFSAFRLIYFLMKSCDLKSRKTGSSLRLKRNCLNANMHEYTKSNSNSNVWAIMLRERVNFSLPILLHVNRSTLESELD